MSWKCLVNINAREKEFRWSKFYVFSKQHIFLNVLNKWESSNFYELGVRQHFLPFFYGQTSLSPIVIWLTPLPWERRVVQVWLRSMHDDGWWCWRKQLNISPLYDKFEIGILRQTKLGAEVERQYFTQLSMYFIVKWHFSEYFIDISAYFAATEFQLESGVTNLQKEKDLKG